MRKISYETNITKLREIVEKLERRSQLRGIAKAF